MTWDRFIRGKMPYVLLLGAVLLVWGQSLRFQFVWDDLYFIENLESIRSLRNIPSMFTDLEAQSSYPSGFKLFRPLRTIHYALLYFLGGGQPPRPWLFHAANLVWHYLAAVLIYALLTRLLQRQTGDEPGSWRIGSAALLAALGYALHPVLSEVVCWSKSLDDEMATVFLLSALWGLIRWSGERWDVHFAVCLGGYILALYSKISAFPWPAVVFLWCYWLLRQSWVRAFRLSLPFWVAGLAFLAHRHWVIGQTAQASPLSGSYVQTLVDMLPVVPTYLRLVLGIPPFCIDYSFLKGGYGWTSMPVITGLALLAGYLGLAWWLIRKPAGRMAGFGLIWIFLFLLPVANLVPSMQYLAERFLYLPMVGGAMIIASLLVHGPRPRVSRILYGVVVLFWALLAWDRSWIWQDGLTLFVRSSIEYPHCKRMENNAMVAAFRLPHMQPVFQTETKPGQLPELNYQDPGALPPSEWSKVNNTLLQLHALYPKNPTVLVTLGYVSLLQNRYTEAIQYSELAVRTDPNNPQFWGNLGWAYARDRQYEAAEKALGRALDLNPRYIPAHQGLFHFHVSKQDFDKARKVLLELKRLDPGNRIYDEWADQLQTRPTNYPSINERHEIHPRSEPTTP